MPDKTTAKTAHSKKNISQIYSAWFGKSVVLLVVVRHCSMPLPCSIVGETGDDVRVRIEPGWEMNVRKEVILAVEEYTPSPEHRMAGDLSRVN